MEYTHKSRDYSADKVRSRYVMATRAGTFEFCEVGEDRRYNIAVGTVEASALPPTVASAAVERRKAGVWPFYVDWPLDSHARAA